jgi:SAM-dependent methyltransferase
MAKQLGNLAPGAQGRGMSEQRESDGEVKAFWEARYAEREQIWSGRANHWLVEVASAWSPGRALDLGCGEGGDSVWLAENGWEVTGVDISETALSRAAAAARDRGVADRIRFVRADLSDGVPHGRFDLVSAQFLQSFVHLDRPRIFAAVADAVAPGGHFLLVDHGAPPPWAPAEVHDHVFPTVEEVLATIGVEGVWAVERAGAAQRHGSGPDGQEGLLVDNVIVLRRLGGVVGGRGVASMPCSNRSSISDSCGVVGVPSRGG